METEDRDGTHVEQHGDGDNVTVENVTVENDQGGQDPREVDEK